MSIQNFKSFFFYYIFYKILKNNTTKLENTTISLKTIFDASLQLISKGIYYVLND